jgi:hypothetical protein
MDKAGAVCRCLCVSCQRLRIGELFRDLSDKVLSEKNETDYTDVREWLYNLREAAEHVEMLDLAVLLREVASRGDRRSASCAGKFCSRFCNSPTAKTETSYLSFRFYDYCARTRTKLAELAARIFPRIFKSTAIGKSAVVNR